MAQSDETKIAVMANDISYIKKGQDRIEASLDKLSNTFVSKQEFEDFKNSDFANIKRLVYGFVALVLTTVVGAVLGFVIVRPK